MMIALAVISGIGLVLAKYISQTNKLGSSRGLLEERRDLKVRIFRALTDKDVCGLNLIGFKAAEASVPSIRNRINGTESVVASVGMKYGTGLFVTSFELVDRPGMGDGVEVIPGESGSTHLIMKFASDHRNMNPDAIPQEKIKLVVQTNSAGMIESCFAASSGEDHLWLRQASNPNNIYYEEGRVGVGTSDPQELLHVAGNLIAANGAGDRITLGGAPSQYSLNLSADKVLEVWNEVTNSPALIRAGSIRADYVTLTNSPNACTAANQGAISFQGGKVAICENGVWRQKEIVTWCTPPARIKKGDDEWIRFHQTTQFRPQGYKCDTTQRAKSKHAKIDSTGFKIKYDDTSKPCSNNTNCREYNPEHQ